MNRYELLARMSEIVDRANREGRDLTDAEDREFNDLEGQIRALDGDRQARDIRALAHGGQRATPIGDGSARQHSRAVFGREDRVVDWVSERGSVRPSDLSESEVQDFSMGRAIRGMVTGRWDDADAERRALAEGTDATGGFLTPEVLGAQVIDRVRNTARVFQAGAQAVPLESDEHSIPRLAAGVTGAWRDENTPVAESDPSFERVVFRPKTLAVLVRMSYELFEDMRPASADAIENELIRALSLELDRVGLRGSGVSPEPAGIRNQAGVTVAELGAGDGESITDYTSFIDAVASVQGQNHEPNAQIYASRTAQSVAKFEDSTGQPLRRPQYLDSVSPLVSNQVPTDLTVGVNTDGSEVYTGEWANLLVGARPEIGVRVRSTPDRFVDEMQVALLAYLRADVQLAHPEAFHVTTGVRP